MNNPLFATITGLALMSTVAAQATTAPAPPCLEKPELRGMIAYFLPNVLREVSTNCTPHLPAESYLRTGLSRTIEELEGAKAASWPVAKAAFLKLGDPKDSKKMAALRDSELRPIVDGVMTEKIKIPVTASTCGEVNDIAETLAPLSPSQTVDLIAAIFGAAGRNAKSLRTCPRELK